MKDEKDENKDDKKKEKHPNLHITELFMAKCGKNGWDRCYHGEIYRELDETGDEIAVHGKIYMEDEGIIWSRDVNQDAYGENLDAILELRLDYGMHNDPGKTSIVAENDFFHN